MRIAVMCQPIDRVLPPHQNSIVYDGELRSRLSDAARAFLLANRTWRLVANRVLAAAQCTPAGPLERGAG